MKRSFLLLCALLTPVIAHGAAQTTTDNLQTANTNSALQRVIRLLDKENMPPRSPGGTKKRRSFSPIQASEDTPENARELQPPAKRVRIDTECKRVIINDVGEFTFFDTHTYLLQLIYENKKAEVVRYIRLIQSINFHTITGITPLIYAVVQNNIPMVALLLFLGADPNLASDSDMKPIDYAQSNDMRKLLNEQEIRRFDGKYYRCPICHRLIPVSAKLRHVQQPLLENLCLECGLPLYP